MQDIPKALLRLVVQVGHGFTAAVPMENPYCSLTAAVPMENPYCSCKLQSLWRTPTAVVS